MTMDFALATTKRIKDAEAEIRRLATLESPVQYNYQGDINPVVNGNMAVNQRAGAYGVPNGAVKTLDQYYAYNDAAVASIQVTQQAMPFNETAFFPEMAPVNFLRWAQFTASSGQTVPQIYNLVENPVLWAGLPVTCSFWARSSVNGAALSFYIKQIATGGISNNIQNYVLTTSWKKYTYQVTLGNTITNPFVGQASLALTWILGPNVIQNLDLTNVQLDRGNVAAPFKYESFETTLRRCKRYYQKSFDYATAPADNVASGRKTFPYAFVGALFIATTDFEIEMRVKPTITFYNPSAGTAGQVVNYNTGTSAAAGTTGLLTETNAKTINLQSSIPAGSAAGHLLSVHYTASAEI